MINTEDLNYKDNFIPLFPFNEPNQSAVIAKDQVLIKDSNENILFNLDAEIRLDLLPKPRIHIHVTNIDELDYSKRVELSTLAITQELYSLELKSHKKHINAYITSSHLSNPKEYSLIFSPPSEPIIGLGNEDTQMQYVVFHLFNFKRICANKGSYCENVHLEADNWVIELKSLAESENNFEILKKEGGYGLTHIGHLRKKDNTFISGKEAREMLNALRYFFSFAKGNWCNPVCAVGFDSSDRVWELWSSPIESCFSQKGSWFDEHHSEQLENLFPGFINHWVTEDWNDTLQKVIYWYLNANTSRIDAGIILTQSALERLSYEYFKTKSDAPAESASASYKLRRLFSSLNIPVDIAETTLELKKMGDKWKWDDAPHALTEMRNYLVHPKNKYHPEKLGPAIYDSWNLGLWYLELILLKECEYSETYCNRLNPGWVGNVEKVPWEK